MNEKFAQFGSQIIPSGGGGGARGFKEIITELVIPNILRPIVLLIFSLAIIYFFAGVVKYIGKSGDDKERQEGRQMMIYGIIALFVMVAVWGLVNVLVNTFQLDPSIPQPPPFRLGG